MNQLLFHNIDVISSTSSFSMKSLQPCISMASLHHHLVSIRLGQRLHERGFICNRIVFDAVTPSVYTTPIETVAESGLIWKRCQKWSVFKTIRFHLSCKRRNRIDLSTVTIMARNLHSSIKMVNLARSLALACAITSHRICFSSLERSKISLYISSGPIPN